MTPMSDMKLSWLYRSCWSITGNIWAGSWRSQEHPHRWGLLWLSLLGLRGELVRSLFTLLGLWLCSSRSGFSYLSSHRIIVILKGNIGSPLTIDVNFGFIF